MNSKPATDKEWIDAVTNGATVTAHPDTIAMIARDDPQLAERIVPHERIEVGRLVAVRKYKPKPAASMDRLIRAFFDPRHPETIPAGIYLVKWKDGKTSPAAVGENVNGERWLASCNWYDNYPVSYHAWVSVESLQLIVPNAGNGLLDKTRVGQQEENAG